MLNVHCKEIYNICFVAKSYYDFPLPNFYRHDIRFKTNISYYALSVWIRAKIVLSSNIASLWGGAKGVSLKPTSPIRLLRSISSQIWMGAPKSLSCLREVGQVEYTLKPTFVATASKEQSALKLIEWITLCLLSFCIYNNKTSDPFRITGKKFWNNEKRISKSSQKIPVAHTLVWDSHQWVLKLKNNMIYLLLFWFIILLKWTKSLNYQWDIVHHPILHGWNTGVNMTRITFYPSMIHLEWLWTKMT